jgi:protein SCO1
MHRLLLAAIALLAAVTNYAPGTVEAQSRRWGEGHLPNLPVVTQDGKTVQFYDDLIKGRIVVISFIFTACRDFCPLTTARLAQVEEKLGERMGRDVFFISISVDPENDTPQKLKEFADAFHVGPGWQFITGRLEDIRAINSKFGEQMRSLSEHRVEILIGNDRTGRWARNNAFGDIDLLAETVRAWDSEWRDQVRAPSKANAGDVLLKLDGRPGQALFVKLCAPCHTVGQGDRVGPDLKGVTDRRARSWLVSYIKDPQKMRTQKDSVAVELAARYKGVRMPTMGISDNDAADLLAYVELLTYRQQGAQDTSAPHQHSDHPQQPPPHHH